MTQSEFCYWLKGYFELSKSNELTPEQVAEIKRHLDIVFNNPNDFTIPPDYRTKLQELYPVHYQSYASC